MSILIRDATILTQNAQRAQLKGDIYIDDGIIVEISKKPLGLEADFKLDAAGKLVLPGLINTHTHIPMTLLRGYADDMVLDEWLSQCIWPVEAKLTAESIRIGTQLGLIEMIASGTTSFVDMYFFENIIAKWCEKIGIRGFLGFALIDFGTPELSADKMVPACDQFVRTWNKHTLVSPVVAPHSVYTCGAETLLKARDIALKHKVLMHTHCSETRENVYDVQKRYGMRPVAYLQKLGLLQESMSLAHCGWITKNEVQDIRKAGSSISHCPVSNMKIATGGFTPIPECIEADVPVSLGTDGAASNNVLDMFETMKFCALIHKHHRWDPRILPAQTILDFATCGGARALLRTSEIGSIEQEKLADIILIDLHKPHFAPYHDHVSNIVYAAHGCDVCTTIIHGKPVMLDYQFLTVDTAKIIAEAQECAKALIK